jgi:hypothetical protein
MSWSKAASDEIQYLVEWYSAHVNQYDLDHRAFSFSMEENRSFFFYEEKWGKIKFQYFLKSFHGKNINQIFHEPEKKYFCRKHHLVCIAYACGIELNNF